MKLDVFNLQDDNILPFTGCFHPYFYIPNINDASISGLSGFRFIDKVDGFKENPPSLSAADLSISMESESRKPEEDDTSTNMYYIDRIYKDTAGSKPLVLKTSSLDEDSLIITKSESWTDWVIFNPWKEGKKGLKKKHNYHIILYV
jgi:D-hexose-6-phosphate mutarotase